jgi:large subunit ribosomal protein L29
MKKQEELRELSDKDLQERLDSEVMELSQLRINHTITPLDDSGLIKEKRRQIARIHTEVRARELKKEE